MSKQYTNRRFRSLRTIKTLAMSLRWEIKAFLYHMVNNTFFLQKQLKNKKRLHFGSGKDIKNDFINIDLSGKADIFLDARNRLNIPDNSIEYIYSSHFVEHLEHDDLIAHFFECCRILQPGGVLRLGVPDFPKVFKAYCNGDKDFLESMRKILSEKFHLPPDLICAMDYINRGVYEFGQHKICLDFEKIKTMLVMSGFRTEAIKITEFDPAIDVASRREFTFFVEAVK